MRRGTCVTSQQGLSSYDLAESNDLSGMFCPVNRLWKGAGVREDETYVCSLVDDDH